MEDVETLQLDLQSIYEWAEENNMEFNFPKFETLRYCNDDDIKESYLYTLAVSPSLGGSRQHKRNNKKQ